MAIKTMIVMIIGFITSLSIFAADSITLPFRDNNLEQQAELKSLIDDLFGKSTVISVKSASRGGEFVAEASINAFDIKKDWNYGVTYRCPNNCGISSSSIKAYLSSGLKLTEEPSPPFTAHIELERESTTVGEIYIHVTGQYFKVNGVSYYTEASFFDLAPGSSMHPAFLGR